MALKYKVGDRVRIKSLDWYNENKDADGIVELSTHVFIPEMIEHCGQIVTIKDVFEDTDNNVIYYIEEIDYDWTNEMIESLVEEKTKIGTALNPIELKSNANCITMERIDELATKIDKEVPSGNQTVWELPDGYQFVDENGNVINATTIALEKKKKGYPKTYYKCRDILCLWDIDDTECGYYKTNLIDKLQMLLICRDAYWKIAGEEMGLGKPWEPDWTNQELPKYCIASVEGQVKTAERYIINTILAFPIAEMRDAFYENFKEEIEMCKELL